MEEVMPYEPNPKDGKKTFNTGMSYFWCLIFIDPSAPEGTTSDCFLKTRVVLPKRLL